MPFTRTTFIRIAKITASAVLILVIVAYALWRSLAYARGPHITILEPLDGASISAPTAFIRGSVERSNNVTLNGKAISIDEQGNFTETLIVFPGVNIITFEASDQFGRSVETRIQLFRPSQ